MINESLQWGVVFVDKDGYIKHLCLYESEPSEHDLSILSEELVHDEEFGDPDSVNWTYITIDRNTDIETWNEIVGLVQSNDVYEFREDNKKNDMVN
jgi:hypothetical protein